MINTLIVYACISVTHECGEIRSNNKLVAVSYRTRPVRMIEMQKADVHLKFFTRLTTLGTPYDITLPELRIKNYFPADEATDAILRSLIGAEIQ
jgi:hypothetical protein